MICVAPEKKTSTDHPHLQKTERYGQLQPGELRKQQPNFRRPSISPYDNLPCCTQAARAIWFSTYFEIRAKHNLLVADIACLIMFACNLCLYARPWLENQRFADEFTGPNWLGR